MIYYGANTVVTPDSLLSALNNSYNGLLSIQEEKRLEKNIIIYIIEVFKEDCDYIKNTLLTRNYEKAEVDKFVQLADELKEKIESDPEEYLMDRINREYQENPNAHKEFLLSLLENQKN